MKIAKVIFSLILPVILFNSSMAMEPDSYDEENYTQDVEFGNNVQSKNDQARDHFEYFPKLPVELQLMILYFDLESISAGRNIRTRASILALVCKLIKNGLEQFKHKETWIKLIAAEAYVKENSATIVQELIRVALKNDIERVRFLMLGNADLKRADLAFNKREETALISLVKTERIEAIKILITAGVDLNVRDTCDNTALILAADRGKIEIIKILTTEGANLNAQNHSGDTALTVAVSYIKKIDNVQLVKIVNMLIDAGVDLNIITSCGNTALILATLLNKTKIVKILINSNANLDARGPSDNANAPIIFSRNRQTALIIAAQFGRIKIAKMLINAHANLNIQDNVGDTALIWATRNGHTAIVKMLINADADLRVKNNNGETAKIVAASKRHIEIEEMLKSAESKLKIWWCVLS